MTKTIQDVIGIAVKGGYCIENKLIELGCRRVYSVSYNNRFIAARTGSSTVRRFHYALLALDPLFWQALGKELGWEDGQVGYDYYQHWKNGMQGMTEYVMEDGTVEDYLLKLID